LGGDVEYAHGLALFQDAEERARRRLAQNTREVGVALIGQSRALHLLGRSEEARTLASRASDLAGSVAWLRGMAEASALLAKLNAELGDEAAAAAAEHRATSLRRRLRSAAPHGRDQEL